MKLAQLLDSLKRAYDAAKRLATFGDQLFRVCRAAMTTIMRNVSQVLGDDASANAFLLGRY